MSPEQRLAIRRLNEQTKLTASAINALSIAIVGAAVIIPGVGNPAALLSWQPVLLFFVALILHMAARASLLMLRSEE